MQINLPQPHAELCAAFARYEDALVNNRVDVLDELFWDSAHTVRYGVAENLVGGAAIRAFRQSRPAQGLARRLLDTVITTYGHDFGTAMTTFCRAGSSRLGRQSQTWCRIAGTWQVVAAHVSLMEGAAGASGAADAPAEAGSGTAAASAPVPAAGAGQGAS